MIGRQLTVQQTDMVARRMVRHQLIVYKDMRMSVERCFYSQRRAHMSAGTVDTYACVVKSEACARASFYSQRHLLDAAPGA